jgi:hypothetical protein
MSLARTALSRYRVGVTTYGGMTLGVFLAAAGAAVDVDRTLLGVLGIAYGVVLCRAVGDAVDRAARR